MRQPARNRIQAYVPNSKLAIWIFKFNTATQPALQQLGIGDEANLQEMTTEDINIMRYICGTSDTKLREKFLKESKPSLELFNRIMDQHEISVSSVESPQNPTRVNAVTRQSRRTPTVRELEGKGLCLRCGRDHRSSERRLSTDMVCLNCNTTGHLARVCQEGQQRSQCRLQKVEGQRTEEQA